MTLHVADLALRLDPSGPWLLEDLHLALAPGSILGIVGRNGAGKSTLLRCLAGIRSPTRGRVYWDGRDLFTRSRRDRARQVAYLAQSNPVHVDLRVRELVALGRTPYAPRWGGPPRDVDRHVARALALADLEGYAERSLHSLSGGELQRAMLARMLATEARLLILDEPTAALDIHHAFDCLERCRVLAQSGATVVLALHDLELCRRYADLVVCLGERGPLRPGPPREVLSAERIERVFGIRARVGADGLVLTPLVTK